MADLEELNTILTVLQLLMTDSDERFFGQFQLGATRYYTLLHLEGSPGLTLSELSQRLLCSKGNMTRILKSMEEDGLLERRADPLDARAIRLLLTPQGLERLKAARSAYRDHLEERYSGLALYEIDSLQRVLSRLNRYIEERLRPGG